MLSDSTKSDALWWLAGLAGGLEDSLHVFLLPVSSSSSSCQCVRVYIRMRLCDCEIDREQNREGVSDRVRDLHSLHRTDLSSTRGATLSCSSLPTVFPYRQPLY